MKHYNIAALWPWAIVWWLLLICTLVGTFLTGAIWSESDIPVWARLILLTTELSWMTLVVACCSIADKYLQLLSRKIQAVFRIFLLLTIVTFTIASWQKFSLFGAFVDSYSLGMVLNDGRQLLQHVIQIAPRRLAYSVVCIFGVVVLAALLFRYRESERNITGIRFATSMCTLIAVLSTSIVSAFGSIALSSNVEVTDARKLTYSLGEYTHIVSSERAGPFGRLKADLVKRVLPDEVFISDAVAVNRNRRVDIQDYLEGVSHGHKKYNVILVLIESLRRDRIPAFGGEVDVMPALQRLSEGGWVFNNAYSTASHSNYADLPPLSSHYPLRSWRTHFYPENPRYPRVLIYDILKSVGYRTGIFSSQNENWGGMANYLDTGNLDMFVHAENWGGDLRDSQSSTSGKFYDWMVKAKRSGKIDDSDTVTAAIDWLRQEEDEPFFAYLNFQNSHFPYTVPEDFPRQFVSEDDPLLQKLASMDVVDMPISFLVDSYSDSLNYIDSQLARLIDQLEKDGRAENTIFIVSADTAMEIDSGNIGNGGHLYEDVVKVPLVIAGPEFGAIKDNRLVSHMDIPPTILEALDLPPHPAFQGRSLLDGEGDSDVFLVAQTPLAQQYAIIRDGWKLLFDEKSQKNTLMRLDGKKGEPESPSFAQNLLEQLHTWIGIQIDYYDNLGKYHDSYPPVIATIDE